MVAKDKMEEQDENEKGEPMLPLVFATAHSKELR